MKVSAYDNTGYTVETVLLNGKDITKKCYEANDKEGYAKCYKKKNGRFYCNKYKTEIEKEILYGDIKIILKDNVKYRIPAGIGYG